jgi:hypothetical protein
VAPKEDDVINAEVAVQGNWAYREPISKTAPGLECRARSIGDTKFTVMQADEVRQILFRPKTSTPQVLFYSRGSAALI